MDAKTHGLDTMDVFGAGWLARKTVRGSWAPYGAPRALAARSTSRGRPSRSRPRRGRPFPRAAMPLRAPRAAACVGKVVIDKGGRKGRHGKEGEHTSGEGRKGRSFDS